MADLTTLANAKAWIPVTGTADDALLMRLISAASAMAEQYIGRNVITASYTETRSGNGKPFLYLANAPITVVASLTVDGIPVALQTTPGGNGYLFDSNYITLFGSVFTQGAKNVVVSYTAGYAVPPVDIEQAVIDLVAFKYNARKWIGQSSKVLQGEQMSFLHDVPPDIYRALLQYRRTVQP